MDAKTARALISTVRAAAQSSADPTPPADWKATRDGFIDRLDPSGHEPVTDATLRQLVDFLGDSAPSRASRHTAAEWEKLVDQAVTMALGELR